MKRINHFIYLIMVCILFSIIFTGCGGGDGTSDSIVIKEGRFLDSAVSGLQYSSGNQNGATDTAGVFTYEEGKTIKFFIGDIILGETNGKSIITPVDLVSNKIVSDRKIRNISRFLLTLDSDKDPNNGIEIPAEAIVKADGVSIEFDTSEEAFEDSNTVQTFINQVANTSNLVSSDYAQNHLQETLNIIGNLLYSGEWIFTTITTASYGECKDDVGGQNIFKAQLGIMKDGSSLFTYLSNPEDPVDIGETISGIYENNGLKLSWDDDTWNCGPNCDGTPCNNGTGTMDLTFSDLNNIVGTIKAYSCCGDNGWGEYLITGKRNLTESSDSGEGGDGNFEYIVPYASLTLDGDGNDWEDIDDVENDPQGDDISDYSGADIKCYKVAQDQNNIYIWSEMWDGPPNSADFRGGHGNPNWYQYHLGKGDSIAAIGISYDGVIWDSSFSSATVACGNGIEFRVPKSAIGVSSFDIKIDIIIGANGEAADSSSNWITLHFI